MATKSMSPSSQKIWRTKLSSWGTSQAVRIPKDLCKEIGLEPGDELDISATYDDKGIAVLIQNAKNRHRDFRNAPRASLDKLFDSYQGDYRGEELDWGEDVGAEVIR